jgi:hypothetical protein
LTDKFVVAIPVARDTGRLVAPAKITGDVALLAKRAVVERQLLDRRASPPALMVPVKAAPSTHHQHCLNTKELAVALANTTTPFITMQRGGTTTRTPAVKKPVAATAKKPAAKKPVAGAGEQKRAAMAARRGKSVGATSDG